MGFGFAAAAAMPKPSFLMVRADRSSALDLPSDLAAGHASRSKKDFVFIVNPKGGNGRTGREWKKLLPYLRTRLGGQCNSFPSSSRSELQGRKVLSTMAGFARGRSEVAKLCRGRCLQICECITSGPSHGVDLTREAIREGVDAVVAVGGDGTLHEVVNGFFCEGQPVTALERGPEHSTTLGIIPLGTGSDFARTFGWRNDPYEAVERIRKGFRSKIDVGSITGHNGEHHFFINVADIHLSAKAGFYASNYKRFGNLCYVLGSLRAFIGHENTNLKVKINGVWEEFHKVTAICIGNAKYFGGGMKITPTADPFNGNLEVVILQDFKWYDFILKLHKLYSGSHLSEKNVSLRSVKSIEVVEELCKGDIFVQSDGEHLGYLPTKFSIQPAAIEFFC